ncbi:CRISPR-associated endonuclease Cas1 [Thioalkalivibrio nitratireducens]|uniref:CRISPR-associated endonuclease Cas1 n=1 Tax=Thioalkalivibrio nitratireducens TaxID=186931 RepID=UPI0009F98822|nr:CRISPR-associated endonuclease Cas1 [Thioalkalivibrio nitratireducens]
MRTATCGQPPRRMPARRSEVPPKPLYLLDGESREIGVRGESLRIVASHRAVRVLPLRRVQRIVCGDKTRWDGGALCACLARGIPVTWVDSRGAAAGNAFPSQMVTGPIHDALLLYVQLPSWRRRYRNWLRSRRMNVLAHWAASVGPGLRVPVRLFNDLKRQFVYQGRLADHFVPEARAWCASVTVQRLLAEGVDIQYWGFDGTSMDLADDIAGLFWADLNLHCGTLAEQVETGAASLLFFENWAQRNQNRLLQHLGDLKRHLRTELGSWH